MLKKLSIIFIVCMIITSGTLITVNADSSYGLEYTVKNNEVTITGYSSSAQELKIPDEINGYEVTGIKSGFYNNYFSCIESLILPNTLKYIELEKNNVFKGVKHISFEKKNDNFYVEDGCIYSKDKSILYFIPYDLTNLVIAPETQTVNFLNLKYTKIKNLVVPETVKTVLKGYSVYMPDTLLEMTVNTTETFDIEAGELTKLTFGEQVTNLKNTYIACRKLVDISFSDKLKTFPKICSKSIKKLNIPAEVEDIEELRYSELPELEEINVDENNSHFQSYNGVLYKDNVLDVYPEGKKDEIYTVPEGITEIRRIGSAYGGNDYIKQLNLPNSLNYIHEYGFEGCENLESINIPKNIDTLHEEQTENDDYFYDPTEFVLHGCIKLKNILVDEENQSYSVSNNALYSKDGKRLVKWLNNGEKKPNIKSSTTKIGTFAFEEANIENINLKNVTQVAYGSFWNCKELNEISFENVKSIDHQAFASCTSLKDINLVNTESIGDCAFRNCTSLEKVKLSNNLKDIGVRAFKWCDNLVSINIPKNIKSLYEYSYDLFVFSECNKLDKLTVDPNNDSYVVDNNTLYTKDHKVLIKQLDKSITSFVGYPETENIISYAFENCTSLKEFKMPDSIKKLNSSFIFNNCNSIIYFDFNNLIDFDVFIFAGLSNSKGIIIPKTVENITNFYDYSKITFPKFYVFKNSKAYNQIQRYRDLDYAVINEYQNNDTDINVDLAASNVDENTILKASQITSGEDYDTVAKYSNNFDLYDIAFYKDDQKVTIDGTAIVRIPVKEGMDGNKCKVYYDDNGSFTDMGALYKDGSMEFKTDHFSQYVVTEDELPTFILGDVNEDDKVDFLDAIMVLRHDAEIIQLTDNQMKAAEVNKDGKVDFLDAITILRYDAEIINSFN